MKAILEFNLPEDEEDFNNAVKGSEYKYAIHTIRDYVRAIWKYRELSADAFKVVEEIYEHINERINEANFKG